MWGLAARRTVRERLRSPPKTGGRPELQNLLGTWILRGISCCLNKSAGALFVAIDDGVGARIGEGLDGERGIEAAHRGKRRAADDEEIGDIPTLAVAVHGRKLGIAAH